MKKIFHIFLDYNIYFNLFFDILKTLSLRVYEVMGMKTIVTDLDGTLLKKGKLTPRSIEVLKAFQQQHRLILATGRSLESAKHIYAALDMDQFQNGALILVNGLAVYDFKDHEYLCQHYLTPKQAKQIIRIGNLLMFRITIVAKDQRVTFFSLYDRIYQFLRWIIKHKPMQKPAYPQQMPQDIYKIEFCGTYFFPFFYGLAKRLLRSYEAVQVNKNWVEIMPKGTNKVNQLKYLQAKYHLSLDNIYVFGDGENDVEMLRYAKNAYCPVDGLAEAKAAAKALCPSSEDDGVAEIAQKILDGTI